MTTSTLRCVLVLSAMTGVRSTTGLTTLAASRGGPLQAVLMLAMAGEMVADKTQVIGNRTDPLPLGGRAALGALVGGLVAGPEVRERLIGAVLGAATAVAAAHLAYQVRTRLAPAGAAGGVLEDAVLLAVASRYA